MYIFSYSADCVTMDSPYKHSGPAVGQAETPMTKIRKVESSNYNGGYRHYVEYMYQGGYRKLIKCIGAIRKQDIQRQVGLQSILVESSISQ